MRIRPDHWLTFEGFLHAFLFGLPTGVALVALYLVLHQPVGTLPGTERHVLPQSPIAANPLDICRNAQTVERFVGLGGRGYKAVWTEGSSIAAVRWDPDSAPSVFSVTVNGETAPVAADKATMDCLTSRARMGRGSLD
jgi:hypothetical protein